MSRPFPPGTLLALPLLWLLVIGLLTPLTTSAGSPSRHDASCTYDHDAMLELDQVAFDQDMAGGWRLLASEPGCEAVAADLIRDYREHHDSSATILLWHEGQMRASAGQTESAIELFSASYGEGEDPIGWNLYVDASIAFLEGDRERLEAVRADKAGLPEPDDYELRDADGNPVDLPWPPNLPAVDRLLDCFEEDYATAYQGC
jgi:hypothetical protein